MNTWSELLNTFPFEAALVREAEETHARLLESGLGAVQELRGEVERARFFGLAELTRRHSARSRELAERYEDTEVGLVALALSEEIRLELDALERTRSEQRRERLTALAELLAGEAPGLASRVREELTAGGSGGGE